MRRIDIDIGTDGELTIDAVGFSGPDCEQATAFLEEALGNAAARQHKPEYRRRAAVRQKQSLGRRETGP